MKKLTLLFSVILLSGCGIFTASFDNNEYQSFARMESQMRIAERDCNDANTVRTHLKEITKEVEFLITYTKYIPDNEGTHKISNIVRDTIEEMNMRYYTSDPSEGYCKAKFNIMQKHLQRSLESVGNKVRN